MAGGSPKAQLQELAQSVDVLQVRHFLYHFAVFIICGVLIYFAVGLERD